MESEIVVEPSQEEGVRFLGIQNPPPIVERTVINRSEAVMMLQGHDLNLVIPRGLEELIQKNPRKPREIFDDPYLELSPKLSFEFLTEEDIDPRTGMPRILKRKSGVKILAAKMAKFTLSSVSFYSETSKMSAPSWSLPAGPPAVDGTCAAAELWRNPAQYAIALRQGDVEERPSDKKSWICAYCVTGDARIPVQGMGLVRMDDVVRLFLSGDRNLKVLSDSGWTRVTNAWARGLKKAVRVVCTGGHEIRVTPDHKILTTDGWVEAAELEAGDRIVLAPKEIDQAWPSLASIPPIPVTEAEFSRGYAKPQFPSELDRYVGLFLGYMLGNGSIGIGNDGYPNISLTVDAQDKGDLDELVARVNAWAGSDAKVAVADTVGAKLKTGQELKASEEASAHVSWRRMCLNRFISALGLDMTAPKELRRVPSCIWNAPKDGVAGFLSGLFSTDGSVLKRLERTTVTLASVSLPLLKEVQILLLNFGIQSTICAYRASNAERVRAGYFPLYKLDISSKEGVSAFRELIGINCRRKQNILASADLEYQRLRNSRRYAVVSEVLEEENEDHVYDLEVEHQNHRFVANGLVVSNCYAGKSNYMHRTSQYSQTARMIWLHGMIKLNGIELVADVMSRALAAHMANAKKREQVGESTKFFRIHDSGDLTLSPNTYLLWREIASQHPGISFWCPTRQWVFPKFVELVRRNPPPSNLALRPSALHFNDRAPVIDGFSAGSTAHLDVGKTQSDPVKMGIAEWSCPTYQHDGHSCAGAGGPRGEKDCRFCWTYKNQAVSYRAH